METDMSIYKKRLDEYKNEIIKATEKRNYMVAEREKLIESLKDMGVSYDSVEDKLSELAEEKEKLELVLKTGLDEIEEILNLGGDNA